VVLTVDPASATYPSADPSLARDIPAGIGIIRTRSFEPLKVLAAIGGRKAVPHAGFAGASEPGPMQRALRWIRGNWFVPDARLGWVSHAVRAATEVIQRERIDTVIITSPPHSSQLIGLRLKQRYPALRWIADLRDPWTDIYFAKDLHMGAAATRRNARWEGRVMQQADELVVVGPSMKAAFAKRYGPAIEQKIHVIPNGYDPADLSALSTIAPANDRFRITYVGTMAGSYAPQAFFQAVAQASARITGRIELRFVGSVGAEVRAMAQEAGLADTCSWVSTVSHEEALKEMAAANALLLVIPGGAGEERILTGKLFEYIGVGRPIIALGPKQGDAAAIIDACKAGRMFERNEVRAMAEWIGSIMTTSMSAPLDTRKAYERREQARALAALVQPAGNLHRS
jgi:glycosyltransferase involved in cell wall biosynthesis